MLCWKFYTFLLIMKGLLLLEITHSHVCSTKDRWGAIKSLLKVRLGLIKTTNGHWIIKAIRVTFFFIMRRVCLDWTLSFSSIKYSVISHLYWMPFDMSCTINLHLIGDWQSGWMAGFTLHHLYLATVIWQMVNGGFLNGFWTAEWMN